MNHDDQSRYLHQARQGLIALKAKVIQFDREKNELDAEIKRYESFIETALAKQENELAMEIADQVARLSETQSQLVEAKNEYQAKFEQLSTCLTQLERQYQSRQIDQLTQRAIDRLHGDFRGIEDGDYQASPELIGDRLQAMLELDDEAQDWALKEKMKNAGILSQHPDAKAILERIKRKQNQAS